MKTGVAIFALFSLAACGGATTSVPSAGDDPGTTSDAGTKPTPTPYPTAMPTTVPTIGPHPPPTLPPCTDCLATTVSWGPNGGLTSFTSTSSLKACRTYERSRIVGNGAPTLLCTTTIGACVAASISVGDVESALADPDVTAALAGVTQTYGSDSRPCDGTVESITVGAKTIEVGGECTGPTGGCTQTPCVPVPAGLRALVNVLEDLDKQEATAHPECTGN